MTAVDRPPAPAAPSPPADPSRRLRTAAGLGALAGFVALFVLLAGSAALGANGMLEVVHNGVTAFIPLDLFETGIGTFGAYAKGILFVGVSAAVPVAGAVLAILLVRFGSLPDPASPGDGLFAGLLALVVGEALVLPAFGQGLLGSGYGGDQVALHGPLVVACLAYGLVLAGTWNARPQPAASRFTAEPVGPALTRRRVLGRALAYLSVGSVGASVLAVAARVVSAGSVNAFTRRRPEAPGGFGPTPLVTPIDEFYVVAKDLLPTTVDAQGWRLSVSGLVDRPASYTLADLQGGRFPRVEGYRTLQCISNVVTSYGDLIGNQRWAGVRVRDVLAASGVQAGATHVLWRSADGYTESIPVEVASADTTWLADEMGPPGTPLTAEHGYPLRVLIAGRYGMKQPKYLTEIVLADHDEPGFWEQRTWDETAAVRTYSRIDEPLDGDTVPAGTLSVFGVASSGDRGIARVEVSADGGATWHDAEVEQAAVGDGDLSWRRWRIQLPVSPGRATITARAIDGRGNVQDATPRPTLPSGATGLMRIAVTVVPSSSATPRAS